MKKGLRWLYQGNQAMTLEQRLFNIATLIAILMMLLSFSFNLSLGMPPALIGCNLLALLAYSGLYACSRFFGRLRIAQALFFTLSLLLLSLAWFFNAGLLGSIGFLYLGLGIVLLLMMPGRRALGYWVLLFLDLMLVICLEGLFPHWVVSYPSDLARRFDLGLTLGAALLMTGTTMYFFRLHYDRERELLEKATEYKSRFMASMSHELRTPLNALLGFTRVLQQQRGGPLTEAQQRYLERMQSNGLHLLELVNEMLDLGRIEAGRIEAELRPVALQPLLRDCASYFMAQAGIRDLVFELDCPDQPEIMLITDAGRLRQILNNLIGNAFKYTPAGRVCVRLLPGEGLCRIEVEDTGVGIALEHQALIFEPFYQVEGSAGAGLGLAITWQLCRLLGFRLGLSSHPGQGSCFSVEIPLQPIAQSEAPKSGRFKSGLGDQGSGIGKDLKGKTEGA